MIIGFLFLIQNVDSSLEQYQKLSKTSNGKKNALVEFNEDSLSNYAKSERNFSMIVLISSEQGSKVDCPVCPYINKEFLTVALMFRESLGKEGFYSSKFHQKPVFFGRCEVLSCINFYKEGGYTSFPLLLHFRPSSKNISKIDYQSIEVITTIYEETFSSDSLVPVISRITGHNFSSSRIYKNLGQLVVMLIITILMVKKYYNKLKTFSQNPMTWYAMSLSVFMFVMAGTVYNSIHNPSLYYKNPQTKQISLIYPASRQQFVIEGLIISVLFTLGALFFIGFTRYVPTFSTPWKQRGMFIVCSLGSFTCFYWVVKFFKFKNGYYPFF